MKIEFFIRIYRTKGKQFFKSQRNTNLVKSLYRGLEMEKRESAFFRSKIDENGLNLIRSLEKEKHKVLNIILEITRNFSPSFDLNDMSSFTNFLKSRSSHIEKCKMISNKIMGILSRYKISEEELCSKSEWDDIADEISENKKLMDEIVKYDKMFEKAISDEMEVVGKAMKKVQTAQKAFSNGYFKLPKNVTPRFIDKKG